MRGTILGFDSASGEGAITASDGTRVKFSRDAWRSPGEPIAGRAVDFELAGDRAADIFVVPGSGDPFGFAGDDPANNALTWGIISLACAIATFMIGPFGLFTLPVAIVFGIKGRRAGAELTDKTAYYLSVAGLILSAIALAFVVLALAACAGLVGLLAFGPPWMH